MSGNWASSKKLFRHEEKIQKGPALWVNCIATIATHVFSEKNHNFATENLKRDKIKTVEDLKKLNQTGIAQ